MSETYQFSDPEKAAAVKEHISMRHPSNMTTWHDEFTVEFEGQPHYQVGLLCKQFGAKKL